MSRPAVFGVGLLLGALAYPIAQVLTNVAAGRGLLYPKESQ